MSGVFKKSHWQHFAVPNLCFCDVSVIACLPIISFCPAALPALHCEQRFVSLKAVSRVMKTIKNVRLSFQSQWKKVFFFVSIRFCLKMRRDISSGPSDS